MHTTAFTPTPFHRSLLVFAAFGLAIATLAGAHDAWADATSDLFDFRDRAAAHAKDHPPAERFKVICAKTVALGGGRPTISFAGLPGTGAQLAIFTERPFRDVSRAIWLEPHIVKRNEPTPLTSDWAWIYDRNHDGKADWLAFMRGPAWVAPRDVRSGLPPMVGTFTTRDLLFALDHSQLAFWHIVDRNFDSRADALMFKPHSTRWKGWHEGAMMVSNIERFGHGGDCLWRSDYERSDIRRCVGEDGVYRTSDGAFEERGWPDDLNAYLFDLLRSVNEGAAACGLSGGDMPARP